MTGFTTANQALKPSQNWKKGDRVLFIGLGPGWLLWVLNNILDGKAGRIHTWFKRYARILVFFPIIEFLTLLYISGGYGTDADVTAGTHSHTTSTDENFARYFWGLFFINIF